MSRDTGVKQKWLLALAYSHAERHGGEPAPITKLNEAFFDYDRHWAAIDSWAEAEYAKSVLFQTRRAIRALIRRGLMEEAGTTVSQTGGHTRVCKTYRLTDAGRLIGKAEDEAIKARYGPEETNSKLKEVAARPEKARDWPARASGTSIVVILALTDEERR